MVQPYSGTYTATAYNCRFVLSEISEFLIIDNLSLVVHSFDLRMLRSPFVDEILPPNNQSLSHEIQSVKLI